MKIRDIERAAELGPYERAAFALEMGRYLSENKVALAKSGIPKCVHEWTVGGEASAYLSSLHGTIRGWQPAAQAGIRIFKGALKQARKKLDAVTFTPGARKNKAQFAAKRHEGDKVPDRAVRQLVVGLMDPAPLPRLCSAFAYWQATQATKAVMPIFESSLDMPDVKKLAPAKRLARVEEFEVAAHSVAHMGAAGTAALRAHTGTASDDRADTSSSNRRRSMTVLVHGTWARDQGWYQPGGDFHRYLKKHVYPDLYSGSDYFFWSGRYSDAARRAAARKLKQWCDNHPATTLRLIGHSHGANVINIATQLGLKACTLVLLSPPVWRQYLPEMANVSSSRFFTIRPRIDLVVNLDGGSRDYRGTAVASHERRRICAAWGHSSSHEKDKWVRKKVPDLVRTVC